MNIRSGQTVWNPRCIVKEKGDPQQKNIELSCNKCDAVFRYRYNLKVHVKSIHEGVRYDCNQCDSRFTRQSSLRMHKQSLHREVKYDCNHIGLICRVILHFT